MSLDWIKEALSEDAPAGPDLWEDDDPEFSEYYFDAAGRLPEADDYVRLGLTGGSGDKAPDTIFDPKDVDLASELTQIDALLKRTRDLRLLTLRAQWSALAANMEELANSVSAMADLVEEMPDTVHPGLDDGPRDRLEAINDLSVMGAMILPLRYYDIGESGASRRNVMVCRGEVTPHDGEDDLSLDAMIADLAAKPEEMEAAHAHLTTFVDAIKRIELACLSNSKPHTPQLKTLSAELQAVLEVIGLADPKLAEDTDEDGAEETAQAGAPTSGGPAPKVTEVKDHDEARKRLVAVETYFGLKEPSSAAVLLVTQARMLIGKSLIDAFDVLMPNTADRAKVEFFSDNGFSLAHNQLRNLADGVLVEEVEEPEPEPVYEPPAPEPEPEPEPIPEPEPDLEQTSEDQSDSEMSEEADNDADAVATDEEDGSEDSGEDTGEMSAPFSGGMSEPFSGGMSEPFSGSSEPAPDPTPTPPAASTPSTPEVFIVKDAAAAGAQIMAVETYFRAVERSSPIPLLLHRARGYIGKDFETLLKELVPKQDY